MRTSATGLLMVLLFWASPGAAPQGLPAVPRLRALDGQAAQAIETGVRRSPTFGALVEEIERSDVVVYAYTTPYLSQYVSGGLSFVGVSASLRFLKIALDRDLTPEQSVYILAHELQHAVEIARAIHVKTQGDFDAFYRHIGLTGALRHTFETAEARLMGQRVRHELHAEPGAISGPRR